MALGLNLSSQDWPFLHKTQNWPHWGQPVDSWLRIGRRQRSPSATCHVVIRCSSTWEGWWGGKPPRWRPGHVGPSPAPLGDSRPLWGQTPDWGQAVFRSSCLPVCPPRPLGTAASDAENQLQGTRRPRVSPRRGHPARLTGGQCRRPPGPLLLSPHQGQNQGWPPCSDPRATGTWGLAWDQPPPPEGPAHGPAPKPSRGPRRKTARGCGEAGGAACRLRGDATTLPWAEAGPVGRGSS